jgi:hypothetical protein
MRCRPVLIAPAVRTCVVQALARDEGVGHRKRWVGERKRKEKREKRKENREQRKREREKGHVDDRVSGRSRHGV